jgi:hypothetical protein
MPSLLVLQHLLLLRLHAALLCLYLLAPVNLQ